jgi:hypothetical protein
MRINSDDNQCFISIVPREIGLDGSIRFSVNASCGGFSGESYEVWVELDILDNFIKDLKKLDEERSGDATLQGMSPNEFTIQLYSADSLGHIGLTLSLVRPKFLSGRTIFQKLEIGFEIDSSRMADIVKQSNELKSDIEAI